MISIQMILFNMEFESNFVVHWTIEKIAYKGLLCALIHLLNNIKIFSNKKLFMLLFFLYIHIHWCAFIFVIVSIIFEICWKFKMVVVSSSNSPNCTMSTPLINSKKHFRDLSDDIKRRLTTRLLHLAWQ